jgi:hypothetical protein
MSDCAATWSEPVPISDNHCRIELEVLSLVERWLEEKAGREEGVKLARSAAPEIRL